MNQKYNYNFCKRSHGKKNYNFDYCYNHCKKTCPSVSNLWYGKVINPISHFFTWVKYGFSKCTNPSCKACSFKIFKNGCTINRKCK